MAKKLIAGLMLAMFLSVGISASAETAKGITKAGSFFDLTVSIDGIGTIKSTPDGIKCSKGYKDKGTCSYKFAAGTHVTLTPAAGSGSQFKSWTGCIPKTTGISKKDGVACVVKMDTAKKIVATFGILSPGAGAEGGACLAESKCNGALICKNSVCSKCTADADCGSGKKCPNGVCEVKQCSDGMVFITGGTFKMGEVCLNNDPGCKAENPPHDVTVSSFCMDEQEFTNGDKNKLKATSGFTDFEWPPEYSGLDVANFKGDNQPLIDVNWQEAKNICEKQGKRLPKEAEWEYAARGGNSDCDYGTKDCAVPNKDNVCWSCGQYYSCTKIKTCDVRSYLPNAFGLYDMSGNVQEFVEDYLNAYPGGSVFFPVDTYRVMRGGSWKNGVAYNISAAKREEIMPDICTNWIGFRCAMSPLNTTE